MALWIPITVFAAFVQNMRFMLQRHLKATRLTSTGATFARFLFSAPLAAILALGYLRWSGQILPDFDGRFWAFALGGAVAQILATVCVLALFALRNFTVGMTFKNTETLQTVAVGWVLLGDGVSGMGAVAIGIGFVGL